MTTATPTITPNVERILANVRKGKAITMADAVALRRAGVKKDGSPIEWKGKRRDSLTVAAVREVIDLQGPRLGITNLHERHGERLRWPLRTLIKQAAADATTPAARRHVEELRAAYGVVFARKPNKHAHAYTVNPECRAAIRVGEIAKPGDKLRTYVRGDELVVRVVSSDEQVRH